MSFYRKGFDPSNILKVQEHVTFLGVKYFISTVDLGINHAFGNTAPLYYETMIFIDGEWLELYLKRYATEEEALKGHKEIMKALRGEKFTLDEDGFTFNEIEEEK